MISIKLLGMNISLEEIEVRGGIDFRMPISSDIIGTLNVESRLEDNKIFNKYHNVSLEQDIRVLPTELLNELQSVYKKIQDYIEKEGE